ncbi:hypothetical protein LOD99_2058 [Oopsacas minuta]|uniref:Uncharacterized protein n=1 Tax=Oopsacas minuta TaxID=111878 RepID=A0AAV7K2T2_9METZ|nr:hypothetical protein LOD99_2058 [Oopsacas minuta]
MLVIIKLKQNSIKLATQTPGVSEAEWELQLEDLQAVLYTYDSSATNTQQDTPSHSISADLLNDSETIQVSITHPIYLDIILEASISKTNISPSLSVKSTNVSLTNEISEINKLIQLHLFSSLMEACIEIFEKINQNINIGHPVKLDNNLDNALDKICHYLVMKIDHMHDEKRYMKYIQNFSKQTGIFVLIIFTRKIYFILLAADRNGLDQFLQMMRTVNVDVDRKSRPCKERMMKILVENTSNKTQIPEPITIKIYKHLSKEDLSSVLLSYHLPLHLINLLF